MPEPEEERVRVDASGNSDGIAWLSWVVSAAGAVLTSFWLSLGIIFPFLLAAMALDMLTGIVGAWRRHDLSVERATDGAARKAVALLLVGLAALLTAALALLGVTLAVPLPTISANVGLTEATAAFYLWQEALSIIRAADRMRVPLPGFLRLAAERLRPSERRS